MFPIKGNNRPVAPGAGFSLLELMVGMGLSFTIVVATLAAYAFIGRNFTRMANTQRVEASSRRAFAQLAKDVNSATKITSATTTTLGLTLPSGKAVTYTYSVPSGTAYNRGTLIRREDADVTLVSNIDTTVKTSTNPQTSFQFNYFDPSGNLILPSSASALACIKEIELTFFSAYTSDKQTSADNLKKSSYAAVSPRLALNNRSFLP